MYKERIETCGQRIAKALKIKGIRQADLCKLANVPKSSLSLYLSGAYEPKQDRVYSMAKALNVSEAWLLGYDVPMDRVWETTSSPLNLQLFAETRPVRRKRLQMLGNVACGEPIFADATEDAFVDVDIDADFCLTAKGDSMINARIFDGDILFVKQCDIVDNSEIAVVLIGDEATVKRFYYDRENNIVTLSPENPLYKPMRYQGAELDNIRVLGKVVLGQYRVF